MDLMEKSKRADFLFEADRQEAPLAGRHVDDDNASILCCGSCLPAQLPKDGRPPPEAMPPPGALPAATKLAR
uniref:Uncharacterized protein n=1 Tax=Arundo donax TaxID=35708 RepID=A0A0A8XQE9_ARUDO